VRNRALNSELSHHKIAIVAITLEQIVEETRHWPPEKVGELVGRLTADLDASDSETEAAWKREARRRLAEIENGTAQPVDGEAVSARIRKMVGR
jgi:putative addiction module component (TIGR02574 family)